VVNEADPRFVAIPTPTEGRPLVETATALGGDKAWSFTAMLKRVTGKISSQ
jgi:hypothetical protein